MDRHVARRAAALTTVLALGVSGAGCGAGSAAPEAQAESDASPSPSEPKPSNLPLPAQDGRVQGPLGDVVLVPPGFLPRDDDDPTDLGGDTGSFTLPRYVRNFYGGDKRVLKDFRMSRMRRGFHVYAENRAEDRWIHVYLFETRDNGGATMLRSMMFGDDDAESYTVRTVEDAVGQIRHGKSDNGPYTSMEIAYAVGNVYVRVIGARRGGKPDTRLVEKLARLQKKSLQASFSPTA
ncbi:hypothetical protein [Nocardioides iriomotensis]|uniref:Lipoprotein n=1 Tax=Nocardioides iriomotensis TaxID=715784 RepID=A0A4Q5J9D7_9ACTN|nr:hypothetical protein [Nocardioides iriomotensis]RYU14568.1 hypothetical protein ETU37_03375 [Nocardioides iriomotensis]